jgi:hypothetical protein
MHAFGGQTNATALPSPPRVAIVILYRGFAAGFARDNIIVAAGASGIADCIVISIVPVIILDTFADVVLVRVTVCCAAGVTADPM